MLRRETLLPDDMDGAPRRGTFIFGETLLGGGGSSYNIANSVRLDGSADYFSRTSSVSTDTSRSTASLWCKRHRLAGTGSQRIFQFPAADAGYAIYFDDGVDGGGIKNTITVALYDGTSQYIYHTTSVLLDTSAHMHIHVETDTNQSVATDRVTVYVNGTALGGHWYSSAIPQNTIVQGLNNSLWQIGQYSSSRYLEAGVSEIIFVDGAALPPSAFGETDAVTGSWKPKAPSGLTYGTNGFWLDFANTADLGNDVSGNNNDWTLNSLGSTDAVSDTPTNNFATLNPLNTQTGASLTFAEGNLLCNAATAGSATSNRVAGTLALTSKIYFEAKKTSSESSGAYQNWGVKATNAAFETSNLGLNLAGANEWLMADNGGYALNNGGTVSTGLGGVVQNDVVMVAVDPAAGKIWFGKNGNWSGDPAAGTGAAYSNLPSSVLPLYYSYNNAFLQQSRLSFGQLEFAYTPPTGFSALCTANLPAPSLKDPGKQMDVVLYTGNGAARAITGLDFQPDFVWIKSRSASTDHALYDSARGAQKRLECNTADVEASSDGGLTAFNSNGFDLGTLAQVNTNAATYAAWCWKAGGAAVANTDGTITSQVSANPTAGFSVVTWTGTGAAGTVGHGLGSTPKFIIIKRRDSTGNWQVLHANLTSAAYAIQLNATSAQASASTAFNSTNPTATVFSVGNSTDTNASGGTYVAYCWAEVPDFSKFGSYTGNGSADGPFIHCGFRPRWLLVKRTDTADDWKLSDAARSPYNGVVLNLGPNSSAAEDTMAGQIDYLANGFKLRMTNAPWNASGGTYIFAAFAEYPFGGTNTTPGKAR